MGDYVGAPYNFVPFGKKVYRKKEIVKHNQIQGLSGYIEYQVTAQTPIMVDGGDKHFYKGKDGKAAIPGSTMRGLVRSNMQVLSQSSVADDIQNSRLMYRCVGGSKANRNKESYDEALGMPKDRNAPPVPQKVKAGYIRCQNGKYYIIQAKKEYSDPDCGDMNYYRLSELDIIENKHFNGFEMLKKEKSILQNFKFEQESKPDKWTGKFGYKGIKNTKFEPQWIPVYYQTNGVNKVVALSETAKDGYRKGSLITTGYMNKKKALYVIPEMMEIPENQWIQIPSKDVDSFQRDLAGRKNQLTVSTGYKLGQMEKDEKNRLKKRVEKFFDLPENGETKPVFYIELVDKTDKKLYFGFTPHLRLFYDKEIFDGLPKAQKDGGLDYCKALFGFTSNAAPDEQESNSGKGSYRSRLSFQDAVIDLEKLEKEKTTVVLGEPKPTSYLDYLIGKDGVSATAYRDEFELRGMKQYWLHEKDVHGKMGSNKEVGTDFYPYPIGTSFTGRIRFTNLSEEELGMLLWSLLLEKESQQNIGKGKPYGYGRSIIALKQLKVLDHNALYNSDSICLEPYEDQKSRSDEYISKAKEDIRKFIGKDIMDYAPIRDFLWMKNAKEMPDEHKIRYMGIDRVDKKTPSEYQARVAKQAMLDSVGVVLGKEEKKEKPQNHDRNGYGNGNKQNQNWKGGKNYKKY